MTVNPPTVNKGKAQLVATSATGGTQTYTLTLDGSGTTWPNNYKEASSFTCTVTNVSAGTVPPVLGSVLAILIEDAVDVSGNYVTTTGGTTLSTGVLAIVDVTAATSGGTSFTFGSGASRNPALSKFGTFRIVICAGDTLNNALRQTDTTAGTDTTYHEDTDQDNNKKGTLQTATFGSFITGVGGIKCKLTAQSRTAGNWGYGTGTITESLTFKSAIDGTSGPYNDTGAALKTMKVCWSLVTNPGSSDAVKRQDITISSAGVISVPATNIDTDWGQVIGGSSFYSEVAVGQNFGDATTPSGEKAAIYSIGTQDAADNEKMAYVYANVTQVSPFVNSSDTNRRLRTNTADQLASAAVQMFSNSGLTTAGVASFEDSGRTTSRNLFRRTGPTVTTIAIPFLRVFLADAYTVAIQSKSFKLDVLRHSDNTAEPSTTTATTDSTGKIDWSYTIANTHIAFNRFKRTVGGAAIDSPTSAPATFSSQPAYPKHVKATGNAFSGTKEPTQTQNNQFGVNSEFIAGDMWTSTLSAALANSSTGEPLSTTTSTTTFTLGSGSAKFKISSLISSSTLKIATPGTNAITFVDGTIIAVTTDTLTQSVGSWNQTSASVNTALANSAYSIKTSLAYSNGSGSDRGFETQGAPTDASTLELCIGFADTTGQRNTFTLDNDPANSGISWLISAAPSGGLGFTGDTGNYGYFVKKILFSSIDTSLRLSATQNFIERHNGTSILVSANVYRINSDGTTSLIDPDNNTVTYYLWQQNGSGTGDTILNSAGTTMTRIATGQYQATITLTSEKPLKIAFESFVNSSRISSPGELMIVNGPTFDGVDFATGFPFR